MRTYWNSGRNIGPSDCVGTIVMRSWRLFNETLQRDTSIDVGSISVGTNIGGIGIEFWWWMRTCTDH